MSNQENRELVPVKCLQCTAVFYIKKKELSEMWCPYCKARRLEIQYPSPLSPQETARVHGGFLDFDPPQKECAHKNYYKQGTNWCGDCGVRIRGANFEIPQKEEWIEIHSLFTDLHFKYCKKGTKGMSECLSNKMDLMDKLKSIFHQVIAKERIQVENSIMKKCENCNDRILQERLNRKGNE